VSRKSIALTAIAVLVIGALVFYQLSGVQGVAGTRPGMVRTVTVASIAFPHEGRQRFSGSSAIIQEQGWLKEQLARRGIELVWFPVPTAVGGPLINEGFASKRIDFASYGDFPAIIAASGGVDLRLIVPNGRGQNTYLVVRKDLPATSIRDLKGKRIALHRGRPWELSFSKLAESAGLSLDDFRILNINPPASHAALASGDVDAVFLLSDAHLLVERGVGRILWSTKEAPQDWKMRAELFGRGDFVERYPEITALIAEAFVRAAHWSSLPENRERVIDISTRGEAPRSVVEAELDEPRLSWRDRFSPLFDGAVIDHYRNVADYTFRQGLIRTPVDIDRIMEPRFAEQAIHKLKLDRHWPAPPVRTAQAATAGATEAARP